jgi:hypothetical protein
MRSPGARPSKAPRAPRSHSHVAPALLAAASLLPIPVGPTSAAATPAEGAPITSGPRAGNPPFDVSSITVSAPAPVCELDLNRLKGEIQRLSWSPDNAYLHVRTIEDRVAPHDYIVSLEDREVSLAFGEPGWGSAYWARKSDLAAPGVPSLRMEITESNEDAADALRRRLRQRRRADAGREESGRCVRIRGHAAAAGRRKYTLLTADVTRRGGN